MLRRSFAVAALSLLLVPFAAHAGGETSTPSGSLYFNNATDSIGIDGQTVLGMDATYEARIYFPSSTGAGGRIFNEWQGFVEDKLFYAGPDHLGGFSYSTGAVLQFNATIASDAWHHLAYVKDAGTTEQRLYLDGSLVATSAASGDINDGDGQGFIGSIFRDGAQANSFIGFIDTFRISDIPRYSGASFPAPAGDLADDANTLLLYNFNKPDFFVDQASLKITDLSGNNRTGTLGAGFGGATSPAPPGNLGDVDCGGTVNSVDALKILRHSSGLSVSQAEPCPDIGEPLLPASFGDVDCSAAINSVDALKVLRFSAGLSVSQTLPCPEFNNPT